MGNLYRKFIFSIVFFMCSGFIIMLSAGWSNFKDGNNRLLIARGKYIVKDVSVCQDCHTPRNWFGSFIGSKNLKGAALPFKPVHFIPFWKNKAGDIAGLPAGWTGREMVKFLETGKDPKGSFADPPMPAYRFNKKDATAATAYLKSLKSKISSQ